MERRDERLRPAAGTLTALAAALVLCGCQAQNGAPAADGGAPQPNEAPQPTFQRPPVVTSVSAGPGGVQLVKGVAAPDARIRALTPDPASYGATAGHDGRFSLELPAIGRGRLVHISIEAADRSTPAIGWLFIPPDKPERAVLLRPGTAAATLEGAGLLAAIDYDPGGAAAASGRTKPNAAVEIFVDGEKAGDAKAGPSGGWSVRLATAKPLAEGPHAIHVQTSDARVDRTVVLSSHKAAGVFQAVREPDGWRVDWTPSGGGAQTTLVLIGPGS